MQGKKKHKLSTQETTVPCLGWKLARMSYGLTIAMDPSGVSHHITLESIQMDSVCNPQDTLRDLNLYFVHLLFFLRAAVS